MICRGAEYSYPICAEVADPGKSGDLLVLNLIVSECESICKVQPYWCTTTRACGNQIKDHFFAPSGSAAVGMTTIQGSGRKSSRVNRRFHVDLSIQNLSITSPSVRTVIFAAIFLVLRDKYTHK